MVDIIAWGHASLESVPDLPPDMSYTCVGTSQLEGPRLRRVTREVQLLEASSAHEIHAKPEASGDIAAIRFQSIRPRL